MRGRGGSGGGGVLVGARGPVGLGSADVPSDEVTEDRGPVGSGGLREHVEVSPVLVGDSPDDSLLELVLVGHGESVAGGLPLRPRSCQNCGWQATSDVCECHDAPRRPPDAKTSPRAPAEQPRPQSITPARKGLPLLSTARRRTVREEFSEHRSAGGPRHRKRPARIPNGRGLALGERDAAIPARRLPHPAVRHGGSRRQHRSRALRPRRKARADLRYSESLRLRREGSPPLSPRRRSRRSRPRRRRTQAREGHALHHPRHPHARLGGLRRLARQQPPQAPQGTPVARRRERKERGTHPRTFRARVRGTHPGTLGPVRGKSSGDSPPMEFRGLTPEWFGGESPEQPRKYPRTTPRDG